MVIAVLRLILIAFLVYVAFLFLRIFAGMRRLRRAARPRPAAEPRGAMVKDEVCGTYVPRDEAVTEIRDGVERYFCSEECRSRSRTS